MTDDLRLPTARAVCAATLLFAGAATLAADARSDAFVAALQKAVASDDRGTVASMVIYPITVQASGFNIPVNNAAAFEKVYESVFTTALRCAIDESVARAPGQPIKRPPVLSGGALSLAGGAMSARASGDSFKIARISVPRGPERNSSAAPQRVMFRGATVGSRTVQLAGRLSDGQTDTWLIALNKGENADARIEGFVGSGAAVRFSAAATPPEPRPALAPRFARITAADRTDHRIEVIRLASACDPDLTYRMTVSVR